MKKNLSGLLAGIVIFSVFISLFSACAPQTSPAEEGIELTDALGRELKIPPAPKRVAALLGSFADLWVLAGGTLCAAASDAWEDFGLELEGTVSLGGAHSPSLEVLVAANPDLVLASASTASNVEMLETLEAMEIPVIYFDVDCFEDYLSALEICTKLTQRPDCYKQNGLRLKQQIDTVKNEYATSAIPEVERRVLLLRASSTTVKAKGSQGTILGEMLADLGCVNIADNEKTLLETLSVEAVMLQNPHHVFVVTMGSNSEQALLSLKNMIKENPAWQSLEAIREDRLYVMDKHLFNLKPNVRWAEAYRVLYETLTHQ